MYLNKKILSLFTGGCLILSQGACYSNPDTLAEKISQDFTAVAKHAIPAVVSIKVIGPTSSLDSSEEDSVNPFGDDFFQYFFSPRQGGKQQQQQKQEYSGQAS